MKTTDIIELVKEMIIVSIEIDDAEFEFWKKESLRTLENPKVKDYLQQVIAIVEKYRKRVLS